MDRDSFIFYKSFAKALGKLPDAEYTVLMRAIMAYAFEGTEPELDGICDAMWELIRPQLDANNARYENGKKGGRPSYKNEEPNDNQTITKQEPNHNQTITKQEPNHNQTETKQEPNHNQTETKQEPNHNQTETKPKPNENENVNVNENVNEKEEVKKGGYGGKTPPPPTRRDNTALTAFLSECNVTLDNYDGSLLDCMDFEKLTAAYRESEDWLMRRQECRFFSWVCRRYRDIIAGKYKTNKKSSRELPVGGSITGKFNALLKELCDG